MNRVMIIFIFCCFGFAQDNGFIKFNSNNPWIIEVNDTLITSSDFLKIDSGKYSFSARPQISYSWPAIWVEDTIAVSAGDTSYYQLTSDKSVSVNIDINADLPQITPYKDWDYHPQSSQYPKLKTALLITSIATNWLAFYLKRRADKNYSKYNRSSSISDLNKYYDLAGDFDDASTIMLSISAAALAGYIYIAVTE